MTRVAGGFGSTPCSLHPATRHRAVCAQLSGQGAWPKPRAKFLRQASAVEKFLLLIDNLHSHGLSALLLPESVVLEFVPGAHIHASGWAGKPGRAGLK